MKRSMLLLFIALPATGCTAAKSTYHLAQAEQSIYLIKDSETPDSARYEWTKAQEFMKKAREEWGYADYGPAEDFSRKTVEWTDQATQVNRAAAKRQEAEEMPSLVPEEVERTQVEDREILNREDKLELQDLEEDEEK
mgnify:CR=1 FL=1